MSINTLWRTLVRIESYDESIINFVLPGWDHEVNLKLNRKELPNDINKILDSNVQLPYRLHVRCNIGNEDKNELVFENWGQF